MAERVRVTHPRTAAARRAAGRTPTREIAEQTDVGELYMGSLIRSQRRVALTVCGVLFAGIVATALAPVAFDSWGRIRVAGLPLTWLVLGVGVYPALIGLAVVTARWAERNERAFARLLRRPGSGAGTDGDGQADG
ncbi:hypothetical protein [Speluncibacter jeojiensis]|uniref:DUF485 domain-containing protein n=1 Tax=Speluncibacter jeojiensis TaxID=2710754 RepID=A0A9X4M1K0_9ACTN|nr:hypothetical protein [Corynebacteriales bacterium D3-21]